MRKKENINNQKLLSQYEKRVKEIDTLIQHIYEDNVRGKITDDRFATLSLNYENEQKYLKEKINDITTKLAETTTQEEKVSEFIRRCFSEKYRKN